MADKLKTSKASADQLILLSTRLDLKRNIIARIAIALSLSEGTPVSDRIETDQEGYEFNKSTILGPDEILFRAVSAHVQDAPMGSDFFNIIIRNHLERGLNIMAVRYSSINSPVGFLSSLVGARKI